MPPRLSLVAAALALLVAITATPASAAAWKQAPLLRGEVERAAKEDRKLLISICTPWRARCRAQARLLAAPKLRRALRGLVLLAYDAESGEGEEVARRYNVVTFPTLLLVGGDGLEVGRITGRVTREGLEALRDGSGTLAALEKRLDGRPADLPLRLRVGAAWAHRGQRGPAERHLARVIAADPANTRGLAARAMLLRGDHLLLRGLGQHRPAEQALRALMERFPAAPEAARAREALARALHLQGKTRAAVALLARDPDALTRFCWRHGAALQRGLRSARQALELAETAERWAALALIQQRTGDLRGARIAWGRAARLDPADPWYRGRGSQK